MRLGINLLGTSYNLGGTHQYAVEFINSWVEAGGSNQHKVFIFYDDEDVISKLKIKANLVYIEKPKKKSRFDIQPRIRRVLRKIVLQGFPINSKFIRGEYEEFRKYKLDFMIQTAQGPAGFFSGIPYVVPVHDTPYQWSKETKERIPEAFRIKFESWVKGNVKKARGIFVDSNGSKEALVEGYKCDPNKIHVLQFRAPEYIDRNVDESDLRRVKTKYKLPSTYLFYPSGFVGPKNHIGLFKALAYLKNNKNITIPLILVGSTHPRLEYLSKLIDELSIDVRYLGYVENNDMGPLYKLALALVMPTFMGPTNIPVLEAMKVGCPIVVSDVDELKKQIGDTAIFINNSNSIEEIAKAILIIYRDEELRQKLIDSGFEHYSKISEQPWGVIIKDIIDKHISEL